MTKELSIENIKKELIDKISNNSDILEYFENYLCANGSANSLREYGTKCIKDNFIFTYDKSCESDFYISIEVNEQEYTTYGRNDKKVVKSYGVIITIALEDNDRDKISTLIGEIVTELYPDRYNYKNLNYVLDDSYYDYAYHCQKGRKYPVRVVSFTIE